MSAYTIPNVIARDARGDRVLDVYSHLLTERIIYIGTAIDAGVANALIAQLLFLESDNPDSDVQLYVNCDGGDPSAMLAVYDTMRFIRAAVATTCVGQAIGVGAVLPPRAQQESGRPCRMLGSCSTNPRRRDRGPFPNSSCRLTRSSGYGPRSSTYSPSTAARVSSDSGPTRITIASSPPVRPSSTGSWTT